VTAGSGAGLFRIDGARGKEVAVILLRALDEDDELVDLRVEGGVVLLREGVGSRLDYLVDVGVVEAAALVLARDQTRRLAEVVDPARLLVLPEDVRDGHRAVGRKTRPPERIRELHAFERHRPQRGLRLLRAGGAEENSRDPEPHIPALSRARRMTASISARYSSKVSSTTLSVGI